MNGKTMADLMANYSPKLIKLNRGDEVTGKVIATSDSEIILDLGAKTEGVLNKRFIPDDKLASIKLDDSLAVFVVSSENDSNQISVSLDRETGKMLSSEGLSSRGLAQMKKWQKFQTARIKGGKLNGTVVEVNKGGLVVEIDGVRGFLPGSHLSLNLLSGQNQDKGLPALIGQIISIKVLEADPASNRLVLSAKDKPEQFLIDSLQKYQAGQVVAAEIKLVGAFGLIVSVEGLEGVVLNHELGWEKVEEVGEKFQAGQNLKLKVLGIDQDLGRLNLSLKQAKDDIEQFAQKYQADDVVKGVVTNITQNGVLVLVDKQYEGLIPSNKVETSQNYTVGQEVKAVVDSIDKNKHRINLAPFLTSTVGLIYK